MNNAFDELMDKCNRLYEQLEDKDTHIEVLQHENGELRSQIESLQQKVHLCAGYDRLEAENGRLRGEIDRLNKLTQHQFDQLNEMDAIESVLGDRK